VLVNAGQTATLPETAYRIRVDKNPLETKPDSTFSVTIKKPDGESENVSEGKSTLVMPADSEKEVAIRNNFTVITPPISLRQNTQTSLDKDGKPLTLRYEFAGIYLGGGLAPAASDGPVIFSGFPPGELAKGDYCDECYEEMLDDYDITHEEAEALKKDFNLKNDRELDDFLEYFDVFWTYSGSGSNFGDCTNPYCMPEGFFPGYPRFTYGYIGRDSQVFLRNRIVSRDQILIDSLGGNNFSNLFEGQYGSQPSEDRFGPR
jgi:hypothetical protein